MEMLMKRLPEDVVQWLSYGYGTQPAGEMEMLIKRLPKDVVQWLSFGYENTTGQAKWKC